jgi:flagellar protein FlgJ
MRTSTIPLPKLDTSAPGYAKLHKQAQDFEGVFLNSLMKEMFSSVKTDDQNFGGGFGEETWRGMQAEQMANAVAQQGGIGIADQLMPTLLGMQEAAQSKTGVQ